MEITPTVAKSTIAPAIMTPKLIIVSAFLKGMPKTKATKHPVQLPVIGKGIATNKSKAKSLNLSTLILCFFLVLEKNQLEKRSKNLECLIKSPDTFSKKKKTIIAETIFPKTAQKYTRYQGRL